MIRLLAVLAAALIVPFAAGNAFGQAAYVHEMAGTVTGTLNSVTRQLKTGDVISAGTTVSTGERSRAVIKFEDGQIMALAERSSFRIVEYRYVKERVRDSNAVFALLQGGLRFISGVIGSTNRNAFRLTAGTATIGIRGTEGSVVYDQITQAVNAAVAAGEIALTTAQGTQNLGAGETSGPATEAVQQVFNALSAQIMPINTPVVVAASAAAAAAAAEAARLGTPDAIAEAQRLLGIAISAAQDAYKQALDGGAVPPGPSSGQDSSSSTGATSSSPSGAAGSGGGGGGSGSGSGTTPCTPASASPC
jgi:FecR protein